MVQRPLTSAAGVLALLSESDNTLRQHALAALNPLVPQFWAEISENLTEIEALYEANDLPKEARQLAALIISKVYYYLEEYDEALSFALSAGTTFEREARTIGSEEYVETVVSRAVDRYISARSNAAVGPDGLPDPKDVSNIDPKLQEIIEGIFRRAIHDKEYTQAIGIALECRRLDVIQHIHKITNDTDLLVYVMDAVFETSFTLSYRLAVLRFIFPLFPPLENECDHIHAVTRILVTLSDPSLTTPYLCNLIPNKLLLAYQVAFDLFESGGQEFLQMVMQQLPQKEGSEEVMYNNLRTIISGESSTKLNCEFLKRSNSVDMLILKHTKESLEPRSSIYHTALSLQNAYMHSGTGSDLFLRENLEWLGKASNWSKFTATAALGSIHKGNLEKGKSLLQPYLPGDSAGGTGSVYSEGGALYALGLINIGRGTHVEGYMREKLKAFQDEVLQHGAALGLGVSGIGSQSDSAYEDLRNVLFSDSAVAGEACGYAMGLVMLGSGSERALDEMMQYAHETQHEKIIRGLSIGIAFMFYGRQEQANKVIDQLLADKDHILRYGGVYTIALAYAGTADNQAVRRLLHVAVSDTSDDVRRAAVTALAFLLFKIPSQVPRLVQLLSESYNPHVRCGATLALGIACAGTGLQDAVEILEPMTKDPVDFVRQGALVALGMVLVQQSEGSAPASTTTRALYSKIIGDKHEDPMARFGAALGQGLIDAGGRNVTISLQSRAGGQNMNAIIGMVLFCQFWYWYPLAHCVALAFESTAIIGLNQDLKAPVLQIVSNAKPSLFAYPAPTKPPAKEAVEKVATAVLSTTAKAKQRAKEKKEKGEALEGDAKSPKTPGAMEDIVMTEEAKKPDEEVEKPAGEKEKKRKEPTSEILENFTRVTPAQLVHITFPPDSRFQPVRSFAPPAPLAKTRPKAAGKNLTERYAGGGGIIMLIDRRPGEETTFVDLPPELGGEPPAAAMNVDEPAAMAVDVEEAEMPPPFEYPFES
ncbi:26S proteasome regulatory subunit RPN2 [Serendipita indica DSM 11827]|uniref:26S proteasome regulatory subunit RPN2 n=1 Tax=Serendipita indica (strain DSM 11827) TaxID=1109443 RepID=G4TA54_SERID|nr:26S proteasome regulatory subunit RPN2 [Serendipita indica DSM 11827]CCA68184.1 probable RPN2-26S proteasome regulatory subunit [Serendipita indica DSM 11827]